MGMITPITLESAQQAFDAFAANFGGLVAQSGDLGDWAAANLTAANVTNGLLLGNTGQPLTQAQATAIQEMFATIGKFAAWANTANAALPGGVSPVAYFRAQRRMVR